MSRNVRTLPTRQTELWVDRKEMAEHLGMSLSTLDRMVSMGMPSVKMGNARRFKPSVAVAWLVQVGPTVRSWRDAA